MTPLTSLPSLFIYSGDSSKMRVEVAYFDNPNDSFADIIFQTFLYPPELGMFFSASDIIRSHMQANRLIWGKYRIAYYFPEEEQPENEVVAEILYNSVPAAAENYKILVDNANRRIARGFNISIPIFCDSPVYFVAEFTDLAGNTREIYQSGYPPRQIGIRPGNIKKEPLKLYDVPLTVPNEPGRLSVYLTDDLSAGARDAVNIWVVDKEPCARIEFRNSFNAPEVIHIFGEWKHKKSLKALTANVNSSPVPYGKEVSHSIEITTEPLDTFAASSMFSLGEANQEMLLAIHAGARQWQDYAILTQFEQEITPDESTRIKLTFDPGQSPGPIPNSSGRIFTPEFKMQFT